ncbi:hypothetical protein OYC64_013535 [Pagothenia borchgrevinki]|uniref:Uncharacterized protein n=1 Tax=Pagothenia borchgrevinki TaxID=8213 RepID=A0ABD2FUX2_PAGBO
MGRKTKKSDESGGEEGCELASQASNNSAHGEVGNQALSLSDIQKLLAGMEERIIGSLTAQITSNHAAIIRHDETIQAIETSMNDFQGRITTVESTLADIVQENKQLKLKVDDLENRSRRCNIRITGIPERAEGARPTTFIESFLAEIFGPDAFPRPLTVDRAHRLAVQRRQDGAPRPFIACLHHFQMKQRIMQLAREKGPLMYRGAEIHIYADYSAEVARKRAAFTPIKSSLRNAGLAYSLLFPAKLRVVVDGTRHDFNSPAEVAAFLKRREPAAN